MTKQTISQCCRSLVEVEDYEDADGITTMHYTCRKCGSACLVKEGTPDTDAVTVSINRLEPACLFRAYYPATKSFLKGGVLGLDGAFYGIGNGNLFLMSGVVIDFFTGRYALDKTPIYNCDVIEVETLNEFGSVTKDECVVAYSPSEMCYVLTSRLYDGSQDLPMPTKIKSVIGHGHD